MYNSFWKLTKPIVPCTACSLKITPSHTCFPASNTSHFSCPWVSSTVTTRIWCGTDVILIAHWIIHFGRWLSGIDLLGPAIETCTVTSWIFQQGCYLFNQTLQPQTPPSVCWLVLCLLMAVYVQKVSAWQRYPAGGEGINPVCEWVCTATSNSLFLVVTLKHNWILLILPTVVASHNIMGLWLLGELSLWMW